MRESRWRWRRNLRGCDELQCRQVLFRRNSAGRAGSVMAVCSVMAWVFMARRVWADHLRGKDILYFLDSDAARMSLVKGYSLSLPSCVILDKCHTEELRFMSRPWYARVPTLSNLSDLPSRLQFRELERLVPGIQRTPLPPPDSY